MPDLKQTRSRLAIVIAGLVLIDVVAIAMLLTPLAGSEATRQEEMNRLWLNLKHREAAPWRGLDKKIPKVQQQIADFYSQRFPDTYSAISTSLDKIGSESGTRVSGEKFSQKEAEIEGLQRVEISSEVSGDYLQLVRFINGLERSKLFFRVDDLALGNEQNGVVKLQIKLETYLRTSS
jgi:type IV pilus assembly protein PilO